MAMGGMQGARSGHRAVRVGDDGAAWIEGLCCGACGAVMIDAPMACRSCGRRDLLEPFRAAQTGKVFSWTVVHRSYPGIPVRLVFDDAGGACDSQGAPYVGFHVISQGVSR